METRLSGRLTWSSQGQSSKALWPMLVTPAGIVSTVSAEQPTKALGPMSSRPNGRLILVMPQQ